MDGVAVYTCRNKCPAKASMLSININRFLRVVTLAHALQVVVIERRTANTHRPLVVNFRRLYLKSDAFANTAVGVGC